VQEGDNIGDLTAVERNGRHTLCRTALTNHSANEIAILIVPYQRRAHQVRTFGSAIGVGAVAKSAGPSKLGLAALRRVLSDNADT
jgi:hypothetical protein